MHNHSKITKENNVKTRKGRVVILVQDTFSGPVLQFYPTYRGDTKSISNKTNGGNSKSTKRDAMLMDGSDVKLTNSSDAILMND